jgi:hypothetical protein
MLLLMFEAKGDAAGGFGGEIVRGFKQAGDLCIDMCPVGEDVPERWAGEAGAERFGGHVSEGVVVGVEEPVEVGVEVGVVREEFAEDEGLKEPGGVGEVPLGGAGFGTGLDHEVLRREWRGERE